MFILPRDTLGEIFMQNKVAIYKRYLLVLIILSFVFLGLGLISCSNEVKEEFDGNIEHFTLIQTDDSYCVTSYNGNNSKVSIPLYYGDKPITHIGSYAFFNCHFLTDIRMGNNVINIGESAFLNCTSLTSLIIPDGVISIEKNAFQNCYSLAEISIGENVITIGDNAFDECRSLKKVIWNSTKFTAEKSFYTIFKSTPVTSVEIGKSINKISKSLFSNCSMLTEVNMPDTI